MNYYKELELILQTQEPAEKIKRFQTFYEAFQNNRVVFEKEYTVKAFQKPSYETVCTIISPQDVPKRRNLTTREGQINLVHAVAHIEYSAIDLALDGAYRFHGLPRAYYEDWLRVADDEIRHFKMLSSLLEELNASYGDVAVHNALFEASQRTQTLLERMAVVPRYLEANGLDATPMILEKLKRLPKSTMIKKIIHTLEIILAEEVDHVKKGDVWFRYVCKREKVSPNTYFEIIKKYYPQGFLRAKNVNVQARKAAGFSCDELQYMAKKEVC